MARVQFGAGITAIRGSIGGWTFHKNRSGNIIRLRGQASRESSEKQTRAHEKHQRFLTEFQRLGESSKILWDDFATTFTKTDKFGEDKTLTGQNWFESINQVRELIGETILEIPPARDLPIAVPVIELLIDETSIKLNVETGIDFTNTAFLIRTTSPFTRTTTSVRSALRLTRVLDQAVSGIIDITADWEDTHGIPYPPSTIAVCIKISSMIQTVNKTSGITSPGLILSDDLRIAVAGIGVMIIDSTFIIG
ncbi:MAG: hypothetical protein KJI69_06120 [Patescibacteria group bacterium]|nr:hypothetical protein [Patescibacteria group bacterium]